MSTDDAPESFPKPTAGDYLHKFAKLGLSAIPILVDQPLSCSPGSLRLLLRNDAMNGFRSWREASPF